MIQVLAPFALLFTKRVSFRIALLEELLPEYKPNGMQGATKSFRQQGSVAHEIWARDVPSSGELSKLPKEGTC